MVPEDPVAIIGTAGADIGTYIGGFTFDSACLQLADANQHLLTVPDLVHDSHFGGAQWAELWSEIIDFLWRRG